MIPTLHPSPTWLLDGCEYAIAALTEIPAQWIDLSDDERAAVAATPLVLVRAFALTEEGKRDATRT